MKSTAGLMGLILALVTFLHAGEPDRSTLRRLWKAEEILQTDTAVVTDAAVGYSGTFPDANWALAVILAQDDRPLERLQRIADHSTPEGTLMCLLGIRSIDPAAFEQAAKTWRTLLFEPKDGVEIMSGCIVQRVPVSKALEILAGWKKKAFLRDPIPPLEETIRVRKSTPAYSAMNERITISVGPSAPSSKPSGDTPSGK